jgi:vancomycin resistance protein YoaR
MIKPHSSLARAIVSLVLGGGCLVALLLLFILGYQLWFIGRIFPGISAGGIDVGGLTIKAAGEKINAAIPYAQTGEIILTDGTHAWKAKPSELGFFLDPGASAQAAFRVGRSGSIFEALAQQFGAYRYGRPVSLGIIMDQTIGFSQLSSIANQIDILPQEAYISLIGTDVQVHNGSTGFILDKYATLNSITTLMQSLQNGSVLLSTNEAQPLVLDVSAQAELARQLLSQPFVISLPAGQPETKGPWSIEPSVLSTLLIFQRVSDNAGYSYRIIINEGMLRDYLSGLMSEVSLQPENARFYFDDGTRQLVLVQSAVTGRQLNIEKSIAAIQQAIATGQHGATLEFDFTPPAVLDTATAQELGITELIHAETSYFGGSSSSRIHNIQVAGEKLHGILIAPNETFSMATALGDISLETGYSEALIIYGDRTIKGAGGGVCQVSTTLFRAAYFTGFPIVERHAHAYRVSYYELNAYGRDPNLAGLDATVYFPLVDLKFTNDTPYWLLMEVYVSPSRGTILWKFYSTSDGRTVEDTSTGVQNVVPAPEEVFRENPDLAKDEIKQVEWAADGADITHTRHVYRDGQLLFQDSYFTHFEAWGAVTEYGPGTDVENLKENP